jgi:hypothetical protein
MRKRWMLRSVRGEPAADAAAHPSPAHPPESVLQSQLAALQGQRFVDVFAHASPANKAATGPVQHFARMLQSPAYAPLLGHQGAESLQRLQPSPTVFMELVRVYPSGPIAAQMAAQQSQQGSRGGRGGGGGAARPSATYLWCLARQGEGSAHPGCWMVDSVQPVDGGLVPPASALPPVPPPPPQAE